MNSYQKALWYVEMHLRKDLSLDAIAGACEISPFHLTRAFSAATGIPLMRYVRARRLTEAAKLLAKGSPDILSLALDTGYNSHEAFTRAFRDQFNLTPEQIRARGHLNNINLMEALIMPSTPVPELAAPRFEVHAPTTFAGLTDHFPCNSPQGIPALWQKLVPYLDHIPGRVDHAAYGVVFNVDAEDNFDYMAGIEVKNPGSLPQGFQTLQVPQQKYAIFAHKGHIAAIRAAIAYIWNDWLPASGHKAAKAPMLERYPPEFDPATGLGGFELWLPVQE